MREYLDRRELADYLTRRGLKTPYTTLHRYAMRRRRWEAGFKVTGEIGPPFRRYGIRAVYKLTDVEAWVEKKLNPVTDIPRRGKKRHLQPQAD